MKKDDFKRKLLNKANELVDIYFGENNFVDKMANSTMKVFIDCNMDKLDNMIGLVTDCNGDVDAESIVNKYACNIPEQGLVLDIRKYIRNSFIVSILPDKSLNITKEDIMDLLK